MFPFRNPVDTLQDYTGLTQCAFWKPDASALLLVSLVLRQSVDTKNAECELKLLRVARGEKAEYTLRCAGGGGLFARDNQDYDFGD